jgi:hypothetical protein
MLDPLNGEEQWRHGIRCRRPCSVADRIARKRITVKLISDPATGSFQFEFEPESGRARDPHGRRGRSSTDRAAVVAAYLGMIVNRVVDRSTSLCRWNLTRETLESPFVKSALTMVWDFAEVNPFGGISGDLTSAIDTVCKVIRHCAVGVLILFVGGVGLAVLAGEYLLRYFGRRRPPALTPSASRR